MSAKKAKMSNRSSSALTKIILALAGIALFVYLFSIIFILATCALGIYVVYQFIFIEENTASNSPSIQQKQKAKRSMNDSNHTNDLQNWDDF